MFVLVRQEWEESERGWTRPDGFSYHLLSEHVTQFIKAYWDDMPDETPAEYSRPCGEPKLVQVDEETYQKVQETELGLRTWKKLQEIPATS